jgi:immune inhibitor A
MSSQSICNAIDHIYKHARMSDDGTRCMVSPHPDLLARMHAEVHAMLAGRADLGIVEQMFRMSDPNRLGFNDGVVVPSNLFPMATPPSTIRNAVLNRAPLRGTVRVAVILVDFSDKQFDAAHTINHYNRLFFSQNVIPTGSVRDYYHEVTNGQVDIQGDIIGPLRMPRTLADYAHNASGIGGASPNAATMARDAAVAADPHIDFTPYDNDGDGFVDAYVIIHAGSGAEETGNPNDIWSHKWVIEGTPLPVDSTKIYAYLTVPEDARIGVCCHELGHLLFGFPDLYDTDGSSNGIGNWCLMAAGSWGNGGDTPVHPSAWCKSIQGWASVTNITSPTILDIPDVKNSRAVHRLWKDGAITPEYFLIENRQRTGFDSFLPGDGLLIWHIDDNVSTNNNESHYKVALMQADGRRDLEKIPILGNRGDAGDSYPGGSSNRRFNNSSNPNSTAYNGQSTYVSITEISPPNAIMRARIGISAPTPAPRPAANRETAQRDQLTARLAALEDAVTALQVASKSALLAYNGRDS